MFSVKVSPLPDNALLESYFNSDAYTDCYSGFISQSVSLSHFVDAFYTTWLFKIERLILKWLVRKPSTDQQASQLAQGLTGQFAAWQVEGRCEDQLLMCDFQGRTRSWLMVVPTMLKGQIGTRLYFGSAVVTVKNTESGKSSLGLMFNCLIGFHKLYSRALLHCAVSRLHGRV